MNQRFDLKAGAATVEITPREAHFLHGYPFVERISTGTHDPLLSSSIYLTNGQEKVLFISNDILYLNKKSVARIRESVHSKIGVAENNIMIATTHTHSGPVTVNLITSENDPVVPKVDKKLLKHIERGVVESACKAFENAVPAEILFELADASGVGTNRHDPLGPKDMNVPVMVVRDTIGKYLACMLVCSMHPTVLHEDSTLYSSDFPYFIRKQLQRELLGDRCPVIYFTGAAGNQSPRHVTKANTFEEAKRLGKIVADSVASKLTGNKRYESDVVISSRQYLVDLPKREFPTVEWTEQHCQTVKEHFENLKKKSAGLREIRTAEVNWFGAEELLFLSKKNESGSLEKAYKACMPAEIQVVKIGDWFFVTWPGEIFVEYALELKKRFDKIALITYANGELQGYITTKEAVDKGYYEAGNSLFSWESGVVLVDKTSEIIKEFAR